MRYRMYASQEAEALLFTSEEEMLEAISTRGWDLQERAARELVASRARRFATARRSAGTRSALAR